MDDSRHAEIRAVVRSIEGALKCGICAKILTQPQSLPCQHHFCKQCLAGVDDRILKCQTCGVPYWRKDERRNIMMTNMVAVFDRLKTALEEYAPALTEPTPPEPTPPEPTPPQRTQEPLCTQLSGAETPPGAEATTRTAERGSGSEAKNSSIPPTMPPSEPPTPTPPPTPVLSQRQQPKSPSTTRRGLRKRKENVSLDGAGGSGPRPTSPRKRPRAQTQGKVRKRWGGAQQPILVVTGMDRKMLLTVKSVCKSLGGSLAKRYAKPITHVVTATKVGRDARGEPRALGRRTLKYMYGVLGAKWVVGYEWVQQCMDKQRWVDETPYEVCGDSSHGVTRAPQRARQANANGLPKLFAPVQFRLQSHYPPSCPDPRTLQRLVAMGGGTVVETHAPRAGEWLVVSPEMAEKDAQQLHSQTGLEPISLMWILDCISLYKLIPIDSYKLRFPVA